MNAYYMVKEIRDNIGEATSKHWGDDDVLRKLNLSQRMRANELISSPGDWLLKRSSSITPSNNTIALPSDCVKPSYIERVSDGMPITIDLTVRDRRLTRLTGTTLSTGLADAYFLGNVIEVNMDSFTDPVYVWYHRRIPDLHAGTAAAGGATSLTLEAGLGESLEDDYYNDVYIEVIGGTGAGTRTTISDHVGSTRVCTTAAGTFDNTSVYGTVSELPEEGVPFLVLDATLRCMAKPSGAIDPNYFKHFATLWAMAKADWLDHIASRMHGSNRTRTTEVD